MRERLASWPSRILTNPQLPYISLPAFTAPTRSCSARPCRWARLYRPRSRFSQTRHGERAGAAYSPVSARRLAFKQLRACWYWRTARGSEAEHAQLNLAVQQAPGGQTAPSYLLPPGNFALDLVRLTMRIRISFLEKSRANSFVKANPILAGLSSSAHLPCLGSAPIPRG